MAVQQLPPVPPLTKEGFADPAWQRWFNLFRARAVSTISTFQILTANGFSGNSSTDVLGETTVTLSTTSSGILKGSGGSLLPAVAGTDYITGISASAPLASSGGATPALSMTQAGSSSNGWLSSTDWSTFNNKLSGNQTITLSGDVTGSGATAITTTLSASGVTAGTYTKLTVDAKGRVTVGASLISSDVTGALGYTPLKPANNLSDVASASTSRTNLGLGTMSTQSASAVSITGGSVASSTLTQDGWTSYTPTLTAASGTYTSASATGAYLRVGSLVFVRITITITTLGTGTNPVVGLPFTTNNGGASGPIVMTGRENALTGNLLQVLFGANATTGQVFTYSNGNPAASGAQMQISGCFVSA